MVLRKHRPLLEILRDISGNVHEIIRSEIWLAKTEAREELAKSAKVAASLGSGAALALYVQGSCCWASLLYSKPYCPPGCQRWLCPRSLEGLQRC